MYYKIVNEIGNGDCMDKIPYWSFGKTILAIAILKLVEEDKLDLDKSYFDTKATLRQLLRHEAGYSDYYMSKAYHQAVAANEEAWPFDLMLEKTSNQELAYNPGEGWQYSNIGYYYVRKLIEDTCKSSLQEALNRLVFLPLGINDIGHAVKNSDLNEMKHIRKDYNPNWLYHGLLIGSLKSAVTILHALSNGHIINSNLLREMKTPYNLNFDIGNRPWQNPAYALGMMYDNTEGSISYGHTGMGPDSIVCVYHFEKENITIGVSSPVSDQGQVEFEVIKHKNM